MSVCVGVSVCVCVSVGIVRKGEGGDVRGWGGVFCGLFLLRQFLGSTEAISIWFLWLKRSLKHFSEIIAP